MFIEESEVTYTIIDGKKVPVLIPRKFWGRLIGKTITIECISDDKGESYRYVHTKRI